MSESTYMLTVERILFSCFRMQTGQLEPVAAHFTEVEDEQMKNMLRRVDTIVRVSPFNDCHSLNCLYFNHNFQRSNYSMSNGKNSAQQT